MAKPNAPFRDRGDWEGDGIRDPRALEVFTVPKTQSRPIVFDFLQEALDHGEAEPEG